MQILPFQARALNLASMHGLLLDTPSNKECMSGRAAGNIDYHRECKCAHPPSANQGCLYLLLLCAGSLLTEKPRIPWSHHQRSVAEALDSCFTYPALFLGTGCLILIVEMGISRNHQGHCYLQEPFLSFPAQDCLSTFETAFPRIRMAQSPGIQKGDIWCQTSSFGTGCMSCWSSARSLGRSGCPLAAVPEDSLAAASRLAARRAAYLQCMCIVLMTNFLTACNKGAPSMLLISKYQQVRAFRQAVDLESAFGCSKDMQVLTTL